MYTTLSCVDVMWTSYLGRESGLPRTHVTQPLPPLPADPAGVALLDLALAWHARLAEIASPSVEQVYNDAFVDVDAHIRVVLGYLDALADWCAPPRPPRPLSAAPPLVAHPVPPQAPRPSSRPSPRDGAGGQANGALVSGLPLHRPPLERPR